jgi:hypothetical protein
VDTQPDTQNGPVANPVIHLINRAGI